MDPKLDRVEITKDGDDFHVSVYWTGVDRPHTMGWILGSLKLARRLKAAIEAGAAVKPTGILTDIHGHTYMGTKVLAWGRTMNADLKRLGF